MTWIALGWDRVATLKRLNVFFKKSLKKVKVMTWLLGDLTWLFLKKMTFGTSLVESIILAAYESDRSLLMDIIKYCALTYDAWSSRTADSYTTKCCKKI